MAYHTDTSRARLAVSTLAADMADALAGMVPTDQDTVEAWHTASDLIRAAAELQAHVDGLVRAAVIHARQAGASWAEVGQDLGVSRQAAHERYAAAWAQWRTALGSGGPLPDGADDPDRAAARLDRWYTARHPGATQPVSAGVAGTLRDVDLEAVERHATTDVGSWDTLVPGAGDVGRTPREYVLGVLGEFAGELADDAIDAITAEFTAALNAILEPDGIMLRGSDVYATVADVVRDDVRDAIGDAIAAVDLDGIIQRHDPA